MRGRTDSYTNRLRYLPRRSSKNCDNDTADARITNDNKLANRTPVCVAIRALICCRHCSIAIILTTSHFQSTVCMLLIIIYNCCVHCCGHGRRSVGDGGGDASPTFQLGALVGTTGNVPPPTFLLKKWKISCVFIFF